MLRAYVPLVSGRLRGGVLNEWGAGNQVVVGDFGASRYPAQRSA